jgi:hypothetical protein
MSENPYSEPRDRHAWCAGVLAETLRLVSRSLILETDIKAAKAALEEYDALWHKAPQ